MMRPDRSTLLGRHRRLLAAAYLGAAVLLVPWIIVLAVTQPRQGTAVNVDTLRIAVLVAVVLLAAAAVARPYAFAALAGSAAATFAALSAWFYGLTRTTTPPVLKVAGIVGLVITAALAGWVTVAAHRRRVGSLVIARSLLALAALGLAILLLNPLRIPPSAATVDHLKLAWVGLDAAELIALALLAYAIWTAASWTTHAAAVTASLLVIDLLVNVIPSAGQARVQALAMALVELPLAASALVEALMHRSRLRATF
jgi:hypothetical protein